MIEIIILVGPNGVGKTTIKKELEKKTNYKYFVIDRLIDSFVYKKLFNRTLPTDLDILSFEIDLNKISKVYLIYLTADTDTLIKRIREKNGTETNDFINKTKDLFENDYLKKTNFNFIKIDTGKNNITKTVNKIIKFVTKPKNE